MNATNEVSCFLILPDSFVANLKLFHITRGAEEFFRLFIEQVKPAAGAPALLQAVRF